MDLPEIAAEVKKLKHKAHKRLVDNLLVLIGQIQRSLVLRGPYRLVLDSNIVMRLESYRVGKIAEGLLSILLAFIYLKRLPFHIDVVVRPVVFYEFLCLKNVSSSREHWEEFKRLKTLVEDDLHVTLFFDGIETYSGAEYYGKLIENDAAKIAATLRAYQTRDWRFDFIREPGGFDGVLLPNGLIEVPPFFAAQGLYEEIGLAYFDERRASRFFIEHIEKYLRDCKHNDQKILDKYPNEGRLLLTEILKLSPKGNLVGLADVDILTLCNVQSQFADQAHGRYVPASIGLSLDEKLSEALSFFSSIYLSSAQMMGGTTNMDDNMAKMEAFVHDQKRITEGDAREKTALKIARDFIEEVNSFGIFESPMA